MGGVGNFSTYFFVLFWLSISEAQHGQGFTRYKQKELAWTVELQQCVNGKLKHRECRMFCLYGHQKNLTFSV